MLKEQYFCSQVVSNIYSCCETTTRSKKKIFVVLNEDFEISLPIRENDSISIKKFHLTNIPPKFQPTSVHVFPHQDSLILYVVAMDSDRPGYGFICSYLLEINSSELHLSVIQSGFAISYRPLHVAKVSLGQSAFLLITGFDNALHSYNLDNMGALHRSPNRELIRFHWDTRLQGNSVPSVALKLLIEEWDGGSQGIIGFANGLLFWDLFPADPCNEQTPTDADSSPDEFSTNSKWLENEFLHPTSPQNPPPLLHSPFRPIERVITDGIANISPNVADTPNKFSNGRQPLQLPKSPPPPPHSKRQELLFDGGISCLCFYRHENRRNYDSGLGGISPPLMHSVASPAKFIVVGTTNGAALIISIQKTQNSESICDSNNSDKIEHVVDLPDSYSHGGVHALSTADVTSNGFDDVIIGFRDGTVMVATRDVTEVSAAGISDYNVDQMMTFSPCFVVRLPFPVLGLAFGELLGIDRESADGISGTDSPGLRLYADQLVVQTTQSFHVFAVTNASYDSSGFMNDDGSKFQSKLRLIDLFLQDCQKLI